MYKLTFQPPQLHLERLKAKGAYPFVWGGITWEAGQSETVPDLSLFYEGEKAKKHVHEFFTVEELHEATEATD